MAEHDQADLTALTVDLLSAYFTSNSVPSENLSGLIQSTYSALVGVGTPPAAEPETPSYTPAVSVRKSLASPDHIISMIDGKQYRTLKRHLKANGLTPAQYRERYNLPPSYPLVAPSFSEARRAVAAKHGLGGSKKRNRANAAITDEAGAEAILDDANSGAALPLATAAAEAAPKAPAAKAPSAATKAARKSARKAPASISKTDAAASAKADTGADDVAAGAGHAVAKGASVKSRRKLKIKLGDTPALTAEGENTADTPVATKRAYKKRAPKTA